MKLKLISVLICILCSSSVIAQNLSNPLYTNLDTFHFYYRYEMSNGPKTQLFVDSLLWQREQQGKGNRPKYVKCFDTSNQLVAEYISWGDCNLGIAKTYWPNGNIRGVGHYKMFEGESWDSIKSSDCNIYHGEFTSCDTNGDIIYTEKYHNGIFVSQEPPQKNCEIWGVDILLHDSIIISDTLELTEIENLTFHTKYKNDNTSDSLTFKITILQQHKHNSIGVLSQVYKAPYFSSDTIPDEILTQIVNNIDSLDVNQANLHISAIIQEPYGFDFKFIIRK